MSKQKISELVLAKLKQKREEELRTRPHYEVLRLEALMQREKNEQLRNEIRQLQNYCQSQVALLQQLENHAQELDNTGKQCFPRIIIRPQFIATEKVEAKYKQFYRKSGNTFLRSYIQRTKDYEHMITVEQEIVQLVKSVAELQKKLSNSIEQDNKNLNKRRLAILKQQIRHRDLLAEQEAVKQQIANEYKANIRAANQYEAKKNIVQSSRIRIAQIQSSISKYKELIESQFSPNAYREHQERVFSYQIKNQRLFSHLNQLKQQLATIKMQTSRKSCKSRSQSVSNSSWVQSAKRMKTQKRGKVYTEVSEMPTYYSRRM